MNAEFYPKNIYQYEKNNFSDELKKSLIDKINVWSESNEQIIIVNDKDGKKMKSLEARLRKEI